MPGDFAVVVIFIAAGLFDTGVNAIASDTTAAAARGRQTYVRVGCYECHGYEAQGGAGPRLAPAPIPLEALRAFVRGTTGEMPAYRQNVLSDADLADIYAFLTTIRPPKSPDTIPELKGLN